jgi:hypothetical protein
MNAVAQIARTAAPSSLASAIIEAIEAKRKSREIWSSLCSADKPLDPALAADQRADDARNRMIAAFADHGVSPDWLSMLWEVLP